MYYDPKESGRRIAALRKESGMTQEQFAERMNIGLSTLGKLERGLQKPSIDLLIEIAFFFHVSTDYLLLGNEVQKDSARETLDFVIAKLQEVKRKI